MHAISLHIGIILFSTMSWPTKVHDMQLTTLKLVTASLANYQLSVSVLPRLLPSFVTYCTKHAERVWEGWKISYLEIMSSHWLSPA